jgi:hypothetical protein
MATQVAMAKIFSEFVDMVGLYPGLHAIHNGLASVLIKLSVTVNWTMGLSGKYCIIPQLANPMVPIPFV